MSVTIEPLAVAVDPVGGFCAIGEAFTLRVEAAGGYPPYAYQWKKDGAAIPDATDDTYSFTAWAESDGGSYSVVITDDHSNSVESRAALVVVGETIPVTGLAGAILTAPALLALGRASLRRRSRLPLSCGRHR